MGRNFMLMDDAAAGRVFRLAALMRTAPAYVADAYGIQPAYVEKLLLRRGEYNPDGNESLADAVRRTYGEEAYRICMEW